MTDVTLKDVATGYNLKTNLNDNNDKIEAGFTNSLSKVGGDSNQMATTIDMNGQRITGLVDAVAASEPVRLGQAASILNVTATALNQNTVSKVLYPRSAAEQAAGIGDIDDDDENTAGAITDAHYPWGDVRRYQTGATNVHLAIQAALNQNIQSNSDAAPVVTHNETYDIGANTLTWLASGEDNRVWYAENTTITKSANAAAITIGGASAVSLNCKILGNLNIHTSATFSSVSATGCQIRHQKGGEFHVSADGWGVGVQVYAQGYACSFNEFHLGYFNDNKTSLQVYVHADSSSAAVGNTFHGGHFDMTDTGTAATKYIDVPKNTNFARSTAFYSPRFELPTSTTIGYFFYDDASGTYLHWPRVDTDGTVSNTEITFGPDSQFGGLFGGRDVKVGKNIGGTANQTVDDFGDRTLIEASDGIAWTQARAGKASTMMRLRRSVVNDSQIPIVDLTDAHAAGSNGSQGMRVKAGVHNASGSYFYTAEEMKTIRKNSDDMVYHCIVAHTSASENEPGKGADWDDKWEFLGYEDSSLTAWASGQSYTAPDTLFKIGQNGRLHTNQATADTTGVPLTISLSEGTPNTVSSAKMNTTHKVPVYDGSGSLIGYIPIVADF